jgi:ribose/xylose/arabinose/galactoside ABC-type transport system permease subunit
MSPSVPSAIRRRLWFLTAGNLALLAAIYWLLPADASFADVLVRTGPNVAPLLLAALALTGIVFAGAIDLSLGAVIAVAGTVLGILFHHGEPPAVCFAACATTAWSLIALNGCLIRWLKLPAIIVTLAGLSFYRGAALILADLGIDDFRGSLSLQDDAYKSPGNEYATAILLVTLAATLVWARWGKTPRIWLALGCSPMACRQHGLSPPWVLQTAYLAGGVFLGLAALTYCTRLQVIEPARMARGLELQVVGAVVLGGTNIFGGEGSYLGSALGAAFLYFLGEALLYAGVSPYYREVVQGALILGVIGLDCALHRRHKRLEELK